MGTLRFFILFLIVLIQLFGENEAVRANGICNKTEKILKRLPKIATTVSFNNGVRKTVTYIAGTISKNVTQNVSSCCSGYATVKTTPLICKPICSKTCKNGYCRSPNVCGCNDGYVLDQYNKYNCTPRCSNSCRNGKCIAPERCQCNKGYTLIHGICQPVCSNCTHGTCIAPEKCQCLPGYQKARNNTCIPYCTSGCANGTCVSPENCRCLPGYQLSKHNTCKPYCSSGCPHGTCVAPGTCSSSKSEKLIIKTNATINTSYQPICSKGCINSTCVGPETCKCNSGYVPLKKNSCRPRCSNGCHHGACVKPETCICNSGWKMNHTQHGASNMTCQPICTKPCVNGTICVAPETCKPYCAGGCLHGNCVSPGSCVCDSGYHKSNKTGACLADKTKTIKLTGLKDWAKSNWVYILVTAIIILVILLIIIIVYVRCKRRDSEDDSDDEVSAPESIKLFDGTTARQ